MTDPHGEPSCRDHLPDRFKRKVRRKFPNGSVTACPKCGKLFLATSRVSGTFDHSWTIYSWTEVDSLGEGS